jgi:hypothetical protein
VLRILDLKNVWSSSKKVVVLHLEGASVLDFPLPWQPRRSPRKLLSDPSDVKAAAAVL